MARRLFLILFASFIGVLMNPDFLTADDYFQAKKPGYNAVETVLSEPKPEPEPVVSKVRQKTVANSVPRPVVAKATQAVATPVAPKTVNYTVSYYINDVNEYTNSAKNLSYSGIYKFRKMIYGHNSANLLGSLSSRKVGEIITITEGGVAKNYRVAAISTYRKTSDGYLENNAYLMNDIANTAMGHTLALLTCHGKSIGKSDATHRLVIYVDAI